MNNKNPAPKDLVPLIQATKERIEEIKEKKNQINYDKIKVFAIQQLLVHLIDKIEWKLFVLDKTPMNSALNILPHNAFMWTMEEWNERRCYGLFWINSLHAVDPKLLQTRKLQVDVRQLKKFALHLFLGYLKEENSDSASEMMQSAIDYNQLERTLTLQLGTSNKMLRNLNNAKEEFSKQANIILKIKENYVSACFDGVLTHYTERRYAKKFSENLESQAQLKVDMELQKLEKQIQYYNDLKMNDYYITACKSDAYYNDMQNLRTKIKIMEERYENEYARVNSLHERLRTYIQKFHKDTLYLLDYLETYREALVDYRSGIQGTTLKNALRAKPSLSKFRQSQRSTIHLNALAKIKSLQRSSTLSSIRKARTHFSPYRKKKV